MRKKMQKLMLFLLCVFCFCQKVKAEQLEQIPTEQMIVQQMEALQLYDMDGQIADIWDKTELPSFGECIKKSILEGNFIPINDLLSLFLKKLAGEITTQIAMVKKILFVVLLSAMLRNMNTSFSNQSVGEMGFYICYMVLIIVITATFYKETDMVIKTISDIETFFNAMLPVFVTLIMASGGYGQASITAPAVMTVSALLTNIICYAVLPAITMAVSIEMINNITEKPMLNRFTKLFQGGIAWSMKGMAFLFMAMLSLQKLGGSVFSQGISKTAKSVVASVPVVGDIMGGAVDTAAALTGMIRGGTLLTVLVFLAVFCAVPLIRLLIMILIYKITAAAVEPICETRLIKCISAAGDFSILLFGALFLTECMFLFSAVLLLAFF